MFALRILSAALGLGINVILARGLGAAEYGVYQYVLAWVGILTIASAFGLDRVLVRYIAAYHSKNQWQLLRGLLGWTVRCRILATSAVVLAAASAAWAVFAYRGSTVPTALWLGLAMVPLLSLSILGNAALQGLRRAVVGAVAEAAVAKPILFLLLLSLPWWFGGKLTATAAIGLNVATAIVALLIRAPLVWQGIPRAVRISRAEYASRTWLLSAMPLLAVATLFELNTRLPVLLLGSLAGKASTGVFALASTLVTFVGFALTSINVVLSPVIASLHAEGNDLRLQAVVTRTARVILLFGGAGILGLVLFRGWVLGFFGAEYVVGSSALLILAASQTVNLAAGSVGAILVMTGHERDVAMAVGISAVVNIVLGVLLIPRWGPNGAAVAVFASTAAWNAILVVHIVTKLGIDPTVLGVMSRFKAD